MASPQKENGFAQIATELLMPLSGLLATLGPVQHRVLMAVIARQYGVAKDDPVRLEFRAMSDDGTVTKESLIRAAGTLVRRNVLTKVGPGLYRFNKRYSEWVLTPESGSAQGATEKCDIPGSAQGATRPVALRALPAGSAQGATPSYLEIERELENTPPNPPRGGLVGGCDRKASNPESTPAVPDHVVKLAAAAARLSLDFDHKVRTYCDSEFGWPYGIVKEAIRLAGQSNVRNVSWGYVAGICRRLTAEGFKGEPAPRAEDPAVVDERRRLKDAAIAQHHELIRAANSPTPPPLPQPAPVEGPTPAEIWRAIRPASSGPRQRAYVPPRALRGERVVRSPVEVDEAALRAAEAARAEQLRLLERRGVAS